MSEASIWTRKHLLGLEELSAEEIYFVLDTAADLYGQHVALDFVARIRGQLKFDSVRELIDAMGKDTDRARALLMD